MSVVRLLFNGRGENFSFHGPVERFRFIEVDFPVEFSLFTGENRLESSERMDENKPSSNI